MGYFANKEITIEITNKCGASCVMCPRELMTNNFSTMKNELFEKIVEDAFANGVEILDLCGYGDVFLDKQLFAKVKFAKDLKPDCKVFVSTTGISMLPRMAEDIVELIDILKFSIYGVSQETYSYMMGGISRDKAYSNINHLLNVIRETKASTYTVGNFIVMPESEHEMDDWLSIWEPKLSEVYCWKPHNYIYGRAYRDISGKSQKTCGRPLDGPLNVAADGKAHVCCFDFDKKMVVGDMNFQSIDEVLCSSSMKNIQEKHRASDFTNLLCEICDQTVHDESVLVYQTNPDRKVGMSNSSMYQYKTNDRGLID